MRLRPARRRRGMTLIEIVIVVAIMALLMGSVAVYAVGQYVHAQRETARMDIKNLMNALDLYHLAKGRYPDERGGLALLLEARVIKALPKDPWGSPYLYRLVGGEPQVSSYGKDGVEGGTGEDADLSSTTLDSDD